MIFACCALLAIAVTSGNSNSAQRSVFATKAVATGAPVHHSMLDDAPAATADASNSTTTSQVAAPAGGMGGLKFSIEKIKFPTTWEAFQETFGAHMWWTFFVLFLAVLTWVYVKYIRPRLAKDEAEDHAELDENDVTANLLLIPGEEIFFHRCFISAYMKIANSLVKLWANIAHLSRGFTSVHDCPNSG